MTELNYKSTLRGNLNRHVIRSMQLLCNHSASSIARTSHGNESLCITASANLCLPIYREDTQQQPFLVSNERIAVHIMRFVNGVPLLEKGDDAMSCLITRVVRSLNWANYGGYRMRLIPDEDLVRIYHPTQSRSNTDSLLVAPVWELQYTRGGGEISVAAPSAPKDVSDDSTSAMEEDVDRLIIEGPEAVDNGSGVAVNRRAVVSTEEDAETRRFASLVLTVDVCGHKSETYRGIFICGVLHTLIIPSSVHGYAQDLPRSGWRDSSTHHRKRCAKTTENSAIDPSISVCI